MIDEGVRGSVSFRNFRAPGKIYLRRRNWFTASIVLTERSLVASTSFRSLVDLPLEDPRLSELRFSLDGDETLCIRFDPSLFDPPQSGSITYRFKTELARALLARLSNSRIA